MSAILTRQNGVKIGQNRLFEYLRRKKYLCTASHAWNKPSQQMLDKGYFTYKEYIDKNGLASFSPGITGKGQQFICKMVNKDMEFFQKLVY